jgi:hypothetical protein
MADSTASLSVIALSKVNEVGIPTPTVDPLSGVNVPVRRSDSATVVNAAFFVVL